MKNKIAITLLAVFLGSADIGAQTQRPINTRDMYPSVSTDGKRVAFASNRTGPARTGQIWLMNIDGSGLHQLSQGPWSHAQPDWGFEGQCIYAYQLTETKDDEFGSIVRIKVTE